VVEERGGEPFLLPIAGETERTAMALFHHDTPLETPITLRGSIGDSSCLRIRQQRLLPRVRRLDQQRAAMSVGRREEASRSYPWRSWGESNRPSSGRTMATRRGRAARSERRRISTNPVRSRWCGHRARGWSARVVFKDDASGSFASRVLPGWRIGLRLWRHKRRSPLRGIGPIVWIAVENLGLVGDLDAVFINPEGRRP
jgi:hypothetical protein